MMVANIMKNERRWGDLEARKSIVVDYKLGKVTKNNGNRCSAYVPEHHEAIVSPEIARAAHLVASSRKKCGVQDIVVIQQGTLKGFVGIQVLLEANGLAAGKDHQFKGRYDAEKNAVIISLEKDEQSALSPQKCTT